jgi:hypothetical protein
MVVITKFNLTCFGSSKKNYLHQILGKGRGYVRWILGVEGRYAHIYMNYDTIH